MAHECSIDSDYYQLYHCSIPILLVKVYMHLGVRIHLCEVALVSQGLTTQYVI